MWFVVIGIVVAIIFIIASYIVYNWIKLQKYNQSSLHIKTFDGWNSPFHPSVLYFPNGWNGWRYWMVETPFSPNCKPYVDRNECPSIHVSQDGIEWKEPEGLVNPLVNFGKEGEENLNYYSDPHLVIVGDRMECWYRLTERFGVVNNRSHVSLRRIYTEDGVLWSKEEVISNLWENGSEQGLGNMIVSPAVIYDGKLAYDMWFVDSENHYSQRNVRRSQSKDGINWTDAELCELAGREINAWHIDVMRDGSGDLLMTVFDYNNLTLWRSCDGINWNFVKELIHPSSMVGSMYRWLYRACLVRSSEEYQLYFSAYDKKKSSIGLARFKGLTHDVEIYSPRLNCELKEFVPLIIEDEYQHISFIIGNAVKKVCKKAKSTFHISTTKL